MKFEEILPALREGKKVRRKVWYPLKFARKGYQAEENEVYLSGDLLYETDWEIIDDRQYMNFLEAVSVAKAEGKWPYQRRKKGGITIHPDMDLDNFLDDWYVE
jgi:hypothetical protein